MTLKEAIEINGLVFARIYEGSDLDQDKALKLGSEALKRCLLARKETSFVGPGPLPGETTEKETTTARHKRNLL